MKNNVERASKFSQQKRNTSHKNLSDPLSPNYSDLSISLDQYYLINALPKQHDQKTILFGFLDLSN